MGQKGVERMSKEVKQGGVGRKIAMVFFVLLLALMVLVLSLGPSVPAESKDLILFDLEVTWVFLIPALACLLKWNPKGIFSGLKFAHKKGFKGILIYWLLVFFVLGVGFFVIDGQHTEDYKVALKEHNEQVQTEKEKEPVEDKEPIKEEPIKEEPVKEEPAVSSPIDNSSVVVETPNEESDWIGTEGHTFETDVAFECGDAVLTINKIKIKSDSNSKKDAYNFYMIFLDYSIENQGSGSMEWDMAYSGNLYGAIRYNGVEYPLGGNFYVKDADFEGQNRKSEGVLAGKETMSGYCSLVYDNRVGNPEETWPLYLSEPFELELHLVVNGVDYTLPLDYTP